MEHLNVPSPQGTTLVTGAAPSFDHLLLMASGQLDKQTPVPHVRHRIHFCVDEHNNAIVIWFAGTVLFQYRMSLRAARSLLGDLRRSGFKTEEMN